MPVSEALDATQRVAKVLEGLGVAYLIGGSLASSLHGVPRATEDADLVACLQLHQVDPFCAALEGDFYVEAGSIRDAIQHRSCFNVIHLRSMFKIDVFVFDGSPLAAEELARREVHSLDAEPGCSLVFASAEDIVLQKLRWFRDGGGASERQLRDAVGVIQVKGDALDASYLHRWAKELGIETLLETALNEGQSRLLP